ncbi:tetratricopeptide repeat protein, partial [Kamptonema cortianum]|nr:tetratricopeptide repeat protein [Kamptonema cortianum]
KEHFPEDHIKVGWALSYLGDIYRITGEYEKAKNALEQSIIIYKKHLPENHVVIAGILVYLSDVHKDLGEYAKAKRLLEQSLIIYEKHFPKNHPETAWAFSSFRGRLQNYGKF